MAATGGVAGVGLATARSGSRLSDSAFSGASIGAASTVLIFLAVGAALYVAEYAPLWLRVPVSFTIEMLAAIPSIIFGLWGFFILTPVMRNAVEPALKRALGPLPVAGGLFQGPTIGKDLFTGG